MTSKLGVLVTTLVGLCVVGGAACSGDGGSDTENGAVTGATTGSGVGGSGSTGAGGSGTTSSGSGGSPLPVGETLTLTLEPFDVQPGTERQVCKIVNLPVDVPFDTVRFHSTMTGTSHHFNAYKALTNVTAPVSAAESEVHDCPPASEQLSGDAAYIFGAAAPERVVDMPAGVAFHLVPQQRIILEQHVINVTGEVIQGGVSFELASPAEGTTIDHHADVIWFANWIFALNPNTTTDATKHCAVPYDVEVFGLMSHTHKLGSHFSIEKWTSGGTEHLYDSEDWAHPLYAQYDPTVSLATGEGLQWTCTWNNTTSDWVGPGKNSTDEMCMTFAYAYPKDGLSGDPIQCN
jgi:hypothetical protein